MNRFLKVFSLIAIIAVFASCNKDDDSKTAPPRDFGVQNVADMDSINKFLDTHYIVLDQTTYQATFPEIPAGSSELSIRLQQEFPLQSTVVRRNGIDYTIYYLSFREGVADAPCGVDNVNVNYRGTLLDGTQFDYAPVVGATTLSLNESIAGWQDIFPFFKSGTYLGGTDGNPASFTDFGAGAMFLPSGLAYFNGSRTNLPAYSCLVFSFQLFDVTYTDLDGDKILNKDEFEYQKKKDAAGNIILDESNNPIWIPVPVVFSDTDGDGTPNYADVDDDGDGFFTRDEIRKITRSTPTGTFAISATEYWTYAEMFDVDGNVKINVEDDPETLYLKEQSFGCGDKSGRKDVYSNVPSYMDKGCRGGIVE